MIECSSSLHVPAYVAVFLDRLQNFRIYDHSNTKNSKGHCTASQCRPCDPQCQALRVYSHNVQEPNTLLKAWPCRYTQRKRTQQKMYAQKFSWICSLKSTVAHLSRLCHMRLQPDFHKPTMNVCMCRAGGPHHPTQQENLSAGPSQLPGSTPGSSPG